MLLQGDVEKNLGEKYQTFLKPMHTVSNRLIQLEDPTQGMYSFDEISASFFEESKRPASADAVCVNSKSLIFIEFKTGFNNSDDYPKSKDCKRCKEHQKNISGSLLLKIAETHKVYERKFLETITERSEKGRKHRVEFWVVLNDGEPQFGPIESQESILEDLSEVTPKSTNHISRINESVKRFRQPGYWFDEIVVMSASEFKKRKELNELLVKCPQTCS